MLGQQGADSSRGPWPKEKYHELYQYQYQLISAFALLAGSTARMEPKWVKAMAEKVSIMHPAFVSLPAYLQSKGTWG